MTSKDLAWDIVELVGKLNQEYEYKHLPDDVLAKRIEEIVTRHIYGADTDDAQGCPER